MFPVDVFLHNSNSGNHLQPLELLSSFLSNLFVFLLFLHVLSTFYDSNAAFGVQPPNSFHIIAEFLFLFLILFPIWLHFEFPAWSNFGPTQRQHPHFYKIKIWRYHFQGEAKSSFSAWVTLQWLLLICSFWDGGIFWRKINKDCEAGVCHDPCSDAKEMLKVLSTVFSSPVSGFDPILSETFWAAKCIVLCNSKASSTMCCLKGLD